ncbi:TPA: AraC family transcriptional regulator, partial [Escherichia coli]|nr:AraC family transcriptional regulator [Escherichia coli O157]HCU6260820.1 AraC family transcriptional regulator [Escherichia coli]
MIEEGLLLPMNVLLQGQKLTLLDPEMWFLRGNENKDVTLVITIGNNHQKLMVVEDILLLIDRSQIEVTAGKVIYHPLRIDILSKLLAFIDESTGSVEREHHELFADALPFASEVVLFSKVASEAWFLATYLSSDNINEILFQHLRKTECYKLVRY